MVNRTQSLRNSLPKINESLGFFKELVTEWLVCMEYNSLKNYENVVMTIVNPDTSSKADLLHIIKTDKGYICKSGLDVKTGDAKYVLDQWDKILNDRYEIPMIDVDGVLNTEKA
jgi:hypothetical protein